DMNRIYFVTLAKETPSPLRPKSDEEPAAEKKDGKDKKDPKEAKKAPAALKVDVEGLADRILRLPVPAGGYRDLTSVGSSVWYIRSSFRDPKATLCVFDLAARKESVLGPVGGYEISADGKKMLVARDNQYWIVDLPRGPLALTEPLNLSGLQVTLDRHKEWEQIFRECWRQMRDFFYDPGLHGVDWKTLRQ